MSAHSVGEELRAPENMPKYPKILNERNLVKRLGRLDEKRRDEILALPCLVTEKLHGENFRIAANGNTVIFGQRSQKFSFLDDHPRYGSFGDDLKISLERLAARYKSDVDFRQFVLYGELVGAGMHRGFTYPFDGLRVFWFDAWSSETRTFVPRSTLEEIADDLDLRCVPVVGAYTLGEALCMDVESLKSTVAVEDYVEGIVITPVEAPPGDLWPFEERLIVKRKTARFDEVAKKKDTSPRPEEPPSPFVAFVVRRRLENVRGQLVESGVRLVDEMSDLKVIVPAMIRDIIEEENDGQPLDRRHTRQITRAVARLYREWLDERYGVSALR